MTFTYRPGVREKIGLLLGIAGASGSGKTRTALHIANGIAGGRAPIVVIDTEAGRALHYAPKPGETANPAAGTFDFLHMDFPPPFSPERYIEAIRACDDAKPAVIVVDSMTHEWEGEGGCTDIADATAERMARSAASKNGGDGSGWEANMERMVAPSWKPAKKVHSRMMARLIQSRTHLIFCLRAREKIKMLGGKVTPIGFQPLCEKNFMFELSGSFMLNPIRPGRADYSMPHKLNDELQRIFPEGELLGDSAGEAVREWAESGAARPISDKAAIGVRDLIERIQDADHEGLKAITADATVIKQRAWLAENRPELSKRVDDAVSDALALVDTAASSDGDLGQ